MKHNLESRFNLYQGFVEAELSDSNTGQIIKTSFEIMGKDTHNMVMQRAGIVLAAALKGEVPSINWFAVGVGTSAESNTQVKLVSEIARSAVEISYDTTTLGVFVSNGKSNILSVSAVFGNTVSGAISEMGLVGLGTLTKDSGVLMSRKLITPINKTGDTNLRLTWQLIF